MSCLVASADEMTSGILPSLFRVWTLRVPMVFSFFPLSKVVLASLMIFVSLDSVADFSTAT